MMTTVAAARTAAIAVAAAAMTEGQSLALTANEGDSNQREKDRDTENDDTIHPQILQLLTGTVSGKYQLPSVTDLTRQPTAQRRNATGLCQPFQPFEPEAVPVVKIYGLRRL